MRSTVRRFIATVAVAATLLGLSAGAAQAGPLDPPEPGNCAEKVSGTLTANVSTVRRGAPVTVSWVGAVTSAVCLDEVTFRVGTSILTSTQENRVGAKTYRPVTGTTVHLYAVYGSQFRSLAWHHVAIENETPVRIEVTSVRVVTAQESGGDEPYLMMMPFVFDGHDRTGGAGPGLRMLSATGHQGMLGSCPPVVAGRTCPVPGTVGRWDTIIYPYQDGSAHSAEFGVGLIVVAMEEDSTPHSEAIEIRDLARSVAREELPTHRNWVNESRVASFGHKVTGPVGTAVRGELCCTLAQAVRDNDDLIGTEITALSQSSLMWPGSRIEKVLYFINGPQGGRYEVRVTFSRR
ncbi:hypothetical protein ACIBMZ_15985 [Micromonospora sp. NPDC049900]|uniref:hypothetical protein n=1 Tax=Micromonospora sp. NPDC049900 TaxID=3364275 RepID=UPI00378FAEE5